MRAFWALLLIIPTASYGMSVGTLNEFNVNNGSFSSYSDRLNVYFEVHNVSERLRLPIMILLMGEDAYEILVNLAVPNNPTMLTYEEAIELMKGHLHPTSATLTGCCDQFKLTRQKEDENICQYVEKLKKLSRKCYFGTKLGENLRSQFVYGLKNDTIREKLFAEGDKLTFVDAVNITMSLEPVKCGASPCVAVTEQGLTEPPVPKLIIEQPQDLEQVCPDSQAGPPFSCPIPNGVYPGRVFRIQASTKADVVRFSINFQCGPGNFAVDRANDLAIHIDFRFKDGRILVLNTMRAARAPLGEQWFTEARSPIPILTGKPFGVTIVCEENAFKININGTQLADYPYRLPIDSITHLLFLGDIMVQSVKIENVKDNQPNKIDTEKVLNKPCIA